MSLSKRYEWIRDTSHSSKGPDRDRELDKIASNIRKASQVGVRIITYHWTVIPIRRNVKAPGRGGVAYASFRLEDNWRDLPVEKSGQCYARRLLGADTIFLQKIVPVAKECDVRMACHPYDPPGLPFGYQGADNWDSPQCSMQSNTTQSIVDSPHNGFQLCLGTTAEGLKNPRS